MIRSTDHPVSTHFFCSPLQLAIYSQSCKPNYQKGSPIRRLLAGEEPLLLKSLTFAGFTIKSSHLGTRRRRRLLNVLTSVDRRTTRHIKGYGQGCGRDYHLFSPCRPRQPAETPVCSRVSADHYHNPSPLLSKILTSPGHETKQWQGFGAKYQKFSPYPTLRCSHPPVSKVFTFRLFGLLELLTFTIKNPHPERCNLLVTRK